MNGPIVVTGGTGTLGSELVRQLRMQRSDVRILSRTRGFDHVVADLATGVGVDAAVSGAATIVHCATAPRHDTRTTSVLLEALQRTGARPHLLYVSIVGVDRVPLSYYREKLATERLVQASGLDWTIQRATQFHDLLDKLFSASSKRSPFLPYLTKTSVQPVSVADVARRLTSLIEAGPSQAAPDLGGPDVRSMRDLALEWKSAVTVRRLLLPVHLPGAVGRGYRAGGHLSPQHADGTITFEEHLRSRYAPAGG